jgi:type VI protein secretion system component VasF
MTVADVKQTEQRLARRSRAGQTMIEYIIVFVALLATVAALSVFLYALRQQSNRVLDLVASDYP